MVSETITSKSYILGVQKTSLISDIYTIFHNQIVNNVTDPNTSNPKDKFIFPAFPMDLDIDSSNSYPLIIIDSPDQDAWEKITFQKKESSIDVTIDVFSTSMKELDPLAQDVINSIEEMSVRFIKFKKNLSRTSTDHFMRDQIMVHNKTIVFTCKFKWRKS